MAAPGRQESISMPREAMMAVLQFLAASATGQITLHVKDGLIQHANINMVVYSKERDMLVLVEMDEADGRSCERRAVAAR